MVCKQTGTQCMTPGELAVLSGFVVIRCPVTRVIFPQHFKRANNKVLVVGSFHLIVQPIKYFLSYCRDERMTKMMMMMK